MHISVLVFDCTDYFQRRCEAPLSFKLQDVPTTCPLMKTELAECSFVAVLHTTNLWNAMGHGDMISFNILAVLLLLNPKS